MASPLLPREIRRAPLSAAGVGPFRDVPAGRVVGRREPCPDEAAAGPLKVDAHPSAALGRAAEVAGKRVAHNRTIPPARLGGRRRDGDERVEHEPAGRCRPAPGPRPRRHTVGVDALHPGTAGRGLALNLTPSSAARARGRGATRTTTYQRERRPRAASESPGRGRNRLTIRDEDRPRSGGAKRTARGPGGTHIDEPRDAVAHGGGVPAIGGKAPSAGARQAVETLLHCTRHNNRGLGPASGLPLNTRPIRGTGGNPTVPVCAVVVATGPATIPVAGHLQRREPLP